MKKLFPFLFVFLLASTDSFTQSIVSFSVSPSNPTTTDSIHVIVECMFPSGGCDGSATLGGINGNRIDASAFHCVGMLTVICTDYDTIVIPPLAQGSYNFTFTLVTGDGFPCSPGTLPLAIDSITIDVSGTNNTPVLGNRNHYRIFPNPTDGKFILSQDYPEKSEVSLYSMTGALIKSFTVSEQNPELSLSLTPGLYQLIIRGKTERYYTRLTVTGQ
jgi:hypothetical protein